MMTMGRCWATAFGLSLMTAGCGSSDSATPGKDATRIERAQAPDSEFRPVELEDMVDDLVEELNKNEIEPMQAVVLLKTLSGFFAPIVTGANRAMSELGITGNVLALITSLEADATPEQNQQIAQAVADGAEGIGISPFGDQNAPAIDEAVANGVPVVTLDTDASTSRSLFVGILNRAAGRTAAETLIPMLPDPPGTVMIHGNVGPEWVDGYERTEGAREALANAGYTPLVSQVFFFGAGDADDAEWMRSQIATADPPVVGMVGLFNLSYRCVMAADAAGMPELPIVAFDFEPKTVEYMREGRIKATHVQRQYYEGYLTPYILYGIKTIGLDATKQILSERLEEGFRVNIGVDAVPAEKVDAYIDFLDWIGANQ